MNAPRMKLDLGGGRGHVYFTGRALAALWAVILGCVGWLYRQQVQLWTCQTQAVSLQQQVNELQRQLQQHTGTANNGGMTAER